MQRDAVDTYARQHRRILLTFEPERQTRPKFYRESNNSPVSGPSSFQLGISHFQAHPNFPLNTCPLHYSRESSRWPTRVPFILFSTKRATLAFSREGLGKYKRTSRDFKAARNSIRLGGAKPARVIELRQTSKQSIRRRWRDSRYSAKSVSRSKRMYNHARTFTVCADKNISVTSEIFVSYQLHRRMFYDICRFWRFDVSIC